MAFKHNMTLAAVDLFPLRAAGGVSPNMALGLMNARPALLIRITDSDGCFGWGEIWANFPPRSNLHKAHLVDDVITPKLRGLSVVEPEEAGHYLRRQLATYFLHIGQREVFEHCLAGIDMAVWDLALRSSGQTFAEALDLSEPEARTYASSINPPDLERLMMEQAAQGQTEFKLKIGFDDDADLAFVAKGADLLPAASRLMVDNNQTWDPAQAERMLRSLEAFSPLFAEEPIPVDAGLNAWSALASGTSIPLAGGENIYGLDGFRRMIDAGLRFVQPDVAKWGGVSGALALARTLPADVALWPHFMGTAVGQMAALAVTAAIGPKSRSEMDVNVNPLRTELCGDVLALVDGRVSLPDAAGLVAPPLDAALSAFRDPAYTPLEQ